MIAKVLRENLILIAAAFAKAKRSKPEQVSRDIYGKSSFLRDFKAGAVSISISKYDEIIDWFRSGWPKGAPWPLTRAAIIERPKAGKTSRRRSVGKANQVSSSDAKRPQPGERL